jgi:choline-sulfatase
LDSKPNLLVIMSDDHAEWALRCTGNREVDTPMLDHLAQTGVRFTNATCITPVCSPARATFFTGRLPSQHGIHDYIQSNIDEIGLREWLQDEITLTRILWESGYTTGLVGKWHIGWDEHTPTGFDYWFNIGRNFPPHGGEHTYIFNGQPHTQTGYKTNVITERAIDFLRTRDSSHPFFLFVGLTSTHSPWTGHPERLVQRYRQCTFADIPDDPVYPFGRLAGEARWKTRFNRREALAQYYAAIAHTDEAVARIVDEIDAQGLRADTLIVYLSDHGLNCGHHGIWGKGNGTRPLNMLEESIRIPLIVNGGNVFGGQIRAEFVDHMDVFETLLDFAGVTFERRKPYAGRSFARTLTDTRPGGKDVQFGEYGDLRMIRTRTHKCVRRYLSGITELFDLVNDPRETTNIAADHPALIADLSARIETYFSTYEDPIKSGLRVRELPKHNPHEAWRDEPE